MALRLVQVNFKAADEVTLGRFWADALGWATDSEAPGVTNLEPVGFDWPDPRAVCIDLVRVPDPETVRYRVSLELGTSSTRHHTDLVARLTELGATSTAAGHGGAPGTDMADPEGNEFRVLEPRPVDQDTGPIATVVVHCADPRAMVRFWNGAIAWRVHEESDDRVRLRSPLDVGPYLEFVRVPDPSALRSRVHLDLLPDPPQARDAEVDRLRTLGAVTADVGQTGDELWRVLADPEGNEFCVLGRN